jgi:8-oxo-dGTP pyrophosphatase MutT (NUDIX family)
LYQLSGFKSIERDVFLDTTRPEQQNQRGHGVVVACQRADGRWLLIRRSASVLRAPLRICFPGGWVDHGESQPAAVIREMQEELNADVVPIRCVWHHRFTERRLTLWGWLAALQSTTLSPNPAEVHEILWLTSEEAVRHPDVLPRTDIFIDALLAAK